MEGSVMYRRLIPILASLSLLAANTHAQTSADDSTSFTAENPAADKKIKKTMPMSPIALAIGITANLENCMADHPKQSRVFSDAMNAWAKKNPDIMVASNKEPGFARMLKETKQELRSSDQSLSLDGCIAYAGSIAGQ